MYGDLVYKIMFLLTIYIKPLGIVEMLFLVGLSIAYSLAIEMLYLNKNLTEEKFSLLSKLIVNLFGYLIIPCCITLIDSNKTLPLLSTFDKLYYLGDLIIALSLLIYILFSMNSKIFKLQKSDSSESKTHSAFFIINICLFFVLLCNNVRDFISFNPIRNNNFNLKNSAWIPPHFYSKLLLYVIFIIILFLVVLTFLLRRIRKIHQNVLAGWLEVIKNLVLSLTIPILLIFLTNTSQKINREEIISTIIFIITVIFYYVLEKYESYFISNCIYDTNKMSIIKIIFFMLEIFGLLALVLVLLYFSIFIIIKW